jgi:four helix bundle protein
MPTGVKRFEDLIAWQKARLLTKAIYTETKQGPFARDYGLRDQIRRAAVSIMANVAEGFEKGTSAEFHNFLRIAKGSCAEVRSQLYVAYDVEYLTEERFAQLLAQAEEVARVLGGLRAAVERYCTNR